MACLMHVLVRCVEGRLGEMWPALAKMTWDGVVGCGGVVLLRLPPLPLHWLPLPADNRLQQRCRAAIATSTATAARAAQQPWLMAHSCAAAIAYSRPHENTWGC
jgi:hypothetical protein